METLHAYNQVAAVTIARLILGFLFFFQGYDAVMRIGMKNTVLAYQNNFTQKNIPSVVTASAAWFASFTELICGLCLILGLFQTMAFYLLGLNLVLATIGFCIISPLWDTRHVFPRLLLLLILMLVPHELHVWTLDHLLLNI
jgi:putative oxidoreductase